jgi:Protein of unknown function (DUF2846)
MLALRLYKLTLAAALLTLLSACATAPTPEIMTKETAQYKLPQQPKVDKALIYVVRPSGAGALIRFNVFLNDQEAASEMGYNRASQYIYFNVAPGDYTIFSKAENWADVRVSAKAGEVIFVKQETEMGFVMARTSMSKLQTLEGTYWIMKTQPGTVIKTDK